MMAMGSLTNNFHGRDSACSVLMRQTLFCIIVAVPTFIITLPGQICYAQPLAAMCNQKFNYTKGSAFESNLKSVFKSLVQHTSQTGFNTSVHGHSPDQIYGLLQCRGDATAAQCYNCSQEATTTIRQRCGNGVGGRVWFDSCYLRYENYSFVGQLSTYGSYLYNIQKASKPDVFNATVEKLFSNLSTEATSGSSKLYASGMTTVDSLSLSIYGLVQCWRDISSSNCTKCLSTSINSILASFGGMQGARALTGSCTARYEIYSFFNSTALSPPPAEAPAITPMGNTPSKQITPGEAPAITPIANTPWKQITPPEAPAITPTPMANTPSKQIPAPSSNSTGQKNNSESKSSNKLIIIVGVVGGLLLLLL